MKKIVWIFILLMASGQFALADMTRQQRLDRVEKALARWQQGGQVWQGYLESSNGRADLFVQFPGKLRFNYHGNGHRWVTQGSQFKREDSSNGNEFKEFPVWTIFGGQLGKDVTLTMVDSETLERFGRATDVVVCELLGDTGGRSKHRLRIYVSETGQPTLLGWEESGDVTWLRDFRPIQAKPGLFSAPKI